jgi:DNA topoisomerase-3
MQKLLETGKTDLLDKFISKKGRPFKAFLVLKKGEVTFEFLPRAAKPKTGARPSAEPKAPAAKLDFTGQEPVGNCPKCGRRVFESQAAYLCERAQAGQNSCNFKINKVILQQPLDRPQAARLLSLNRTDLLSKFISKTGRPFSAFLAMDALGKVTFEFPPR